MRYCAVLFDLDGTLLDTLADLAGAGNEVLKTLGYPEHPVDAYRYFVGDGLATLVERILPEDRRTAEIMAEAQEAFQRIYSVSWNRRSAPYPGISALLDQLSSHGLRLAILSNKPDAFTRMCVEQLLPGWTFAPVFGQRPGVPKKPDPAGALEVAAALALAPREILYLGDSGTDMRTACAAGMDAVGVLWGFRTAEELRAAGAHHLIAAPQDLWPLLSS